MKEKKYTCPFTGVEFKALETADGDMFIIHPLTGEQLKVNFNNSIKKFNVPKSFFKHINAVTPKEAMEILDVSRARITQIINEQTIPVHLVNGSTVFVLEDVLEYKASRKVGAPIGNNNARKEKTE